MIDAGIIRGRLLDYYSQDYQVSTPYCVEDTIYDTYACYEVDSCSDHVFIRSTETFTQKDLNHFLEQLKEHIEPELVCKGKGAPSASHLYSYVTGVFLSERPVSEQLKRQIHRLRNYKSYSFFRNGYCQVRLCVFDLNQGTVIVSPAARNLMAEYAARLD